VLPSSFANGKTLLLSNDAIKHSTRRVICNSIFGCTMARSHTDVVLEIAPKLSLPAVTVMTTRGDTT
jgi:hypothetical protein